MSLQRWMSLGLYNLPLIPCEWDEVFTLSAAPEPAGACWDECKIHLSFFFFP